MCGQGEVRVGMVNFFKMKRLFNWVGLTFRQCHKLWKTSRFLFVFCIRLVVMMIDCGGGGGGCCSLLV